MQIQQGNIMTPFKFVRLSALVLVIFSAFSAAPSFAADTETTPVANKKSDDYTLGKAAVEKKDWKAAANHFQAAVKANPRSADAHNMLGYSQRWLGNMDASFASYAEALRLDPKHKGAHEYVGVAYLKVKNLPKAQEHLASLESICGKKCEEYEDLAKAIAAYKP
jgi:Flp pilus assembly protein TadD